MCITSNANALRDEHAEHEKGRNAGVYACYTEMLRASESNIVEREAEKRGLRQDVRVPFLKTTEAGVFAVANLKKKKSCFCAADKMRPRHGIYTGADVHANGV